MGHDDDGRTAGDWSWSINHISIAYFETLFDAVKDADAWPIVRLWLATTGVPYSQQAGTARPNAIFEREDGATLLYDGDALTNGMLDRDTMRAWEIETVDRRIGREYLFDKFYGKRYGYAVCHQCGRKVHWAADPVNNPRGYSLLERGKVFLSFQGGDFDLENLLPECLRCSRKRGDTLLRFENTEGFDPGDPDLIDFHDPDPDRAEQLATLINQVVIAKRLGYDGSLDGPSQWDIYDPFDPADYDDNVDLQGILTVVPTMPWGKPDVQYSVGGQFADPSTISVPPVGTV